MSAAPSPIVADLSNYTANLQREVMDPTVAAEAQFTSLTDDDWLGHLSDAFWEARLDGVLKGYTCDDNGIIYTVGTVVAAGSASATALGPPDPAQQYAVNTNMSWSADGQAREMVQLVILYASFRILRNMLRAMRTAFSAAAGPTRFEYQQSASLLTEIMRDVVNRRNLILARLSDLGTTQVSVIDSIMARDESLMDQLTYWVGAGDLLPQSRGLYGYGEL
jgi:hypothetical protein